MDKLAIGFWGCYFGTTALLLIGSAMAFLRSLRRIAINAALSAVASGFFVLAFLGGLPFNNADTQSRFLAHLAALVAILLSCMLLALLGLVKSRRAWNAVVTVLVAAGAAVLGLGWLLSPLQALALGLGLTCLLGAIAFGLCLWGALHGDRLARVATAAVGLMLCALIGLGWIALDRAAVQWQVHAMSAIAATLYVSTMAWVLWARYAYLIELHEVMAHGPRYDPVTRLRSHAETGQLVGSVFKSFRDDPAPLGVMVLTIANLYALEKLHGSVAINHALFLTAGRLRRVVPTHIEMGRLGHDGFLLLMRNCKDSGRLIGLARTVEARLRKPLSISTSREVARLETDRMIWGAEVGVGLLLVSNPEIRGSSAIPMARGMSRTAMSYASRIAWFDHSSGEIVELPVLAPA
jgi:GGDEF domain-containing protein